MSSIETGAIEYVQPSLLPVEYFTMPPEERIEGLIRKYRLSGLIEIEEREIPVSLDDWNSERERVEKTRNIRFLTSTPSGFLYALEDNSQLLLKYSTSKKDYHWELAASELHFDSIKKEFLRLQRFSEKEKSTKNTILTAVDGDKTYTIDIVKNSPKLKQINFAEVKRRFSEIRTGIETLNLGCGRENTIIRYQDINLYGNENSTRKNKYAKNSLVIQYNDDISEKDLIGYSSLIFLSLAHSFHLKSITQGYASNIFIKNRYLALSRGFQKMEVPNAYIFPGKDLVLKLEHGNTNTTTWEIEADAKDVRGIISLLYFLNPNAYGQDGTDGNITVVIPTPRSKNKNIIIISVKN